MALRSMTGFGSVEATLADGRSLGVAVKAVNHRHMDLSVRMAGGLEVLEPGVRAAVKAAVRRGHVEVTVSLGRGGAPGGVVVDEGLLRGYGAAFARAAEVLGVRHEVEVATLLRMPGVLGLGAVLEDAEALRGPLEMALGHALERFEAAREAEGAGLGGALRESMRRVGELAEEAAGLREGVAAAQFERLREKMRALLDGAEVSEDRLLTEAALLAGRGDIEEELVRLRTHVDRFVEMLDAGEEVGRPLDFLLQEMNREANTALSKTGASAGEAGLRLTEIGLAVKTELERAREQVQNLE